MGVPVLLQRQAQSNEVPFAGSPDGESLAVSSPRGTAVWNVASDSLKFALRDPQRTPLQR
jgi:hypothetical protein